MNRAAAVVLTYRRPRLASLVVRALLESEQLPPERILLVVNGEGGVSPELARRIEVLRLPVNVGPAGGFRAGLQAAVERFDSPWLYLCEDDVGLLTLPSPRLAALVARVEALEAADGGAAPVGGVVGYGRDLDRRTGLTVPHVPVAESGFEPVTVAAWGASLVSRRVVEAGVLPDPDWFFAYEDHDFWLRVQRAGFRLVLDVEAARSTAGQVSGSGRDEALAGQRPDDRQEPWRAYYQARNLFELRRRHGRASWTAVHLAKSARRFQLAGSREARRAIVDGLVDGARGRLGKVDRYERTSGES